MDENNTVGNTSKNLVLRSLNFPVWGSVLSVLRKKKVDFPLDVDIPPSSSAICELINPIKVNQVKDSNWGLPCNVMINVFVFKGSCTAFLLPPRIPLVSRIILPSVIRPI